MPLDWILNYRTAKAINVAGNIRLNERNLSRRSTKQRTVEKERGAKKILKLERFKIPLDCKIVTGAIRFYK